MKEDKNHITVFEHQTIRLSQKIGEVVFDSNMLTGLQQFFGDKGVPYFSLTHKGVCFNEYVGVLQVGQTIIEVLPKADNSHSGPDEKKYWRDILIDMLLTVGLFDVHAPSSSTLKLKPNSILDLYFDLFITEVEYLLHNGLVKKYRKKEGNVNTLKGSLQFSKHIQQNIVHQERFYVRYSVYDTEHTLHSILYKAILLLKQINTNIGLHSRIGALLLYFPEMPDLKVTESTFDKIVLTRKTQSYKTALDIAKLLLLHYHPDVSHGRNDVLALMFDMNNLWEKFVFKSLRKCNKLDAKFTDQTETYFWKPDKGRHSKIRPDILVKIGNDHAVLDTKWKNLNGHNPSADDLRQMYVYHEYFNAKRVALIYPGSQTKTNSGYFIETPTYREKDKLCSVMLLAVPEKGEKNKSIVRTWQDEIGISFETWLTGT